MWYYEGGIRIELDWNVKNQITHRFAKILKIRIELDWNVRLTVSFYTLIVSKLE